jgi:hypothetical protein
MLTQMPIKMIRITLSQRAIKKTKKIVKSENKRKTKNIGRGTERLETTCRQLRKSETKKEKKK